jgi:hypothetical protein
MSIAVWVATVIANLLLSFAIIKRRAWKYIPMFSIFQFIGIVFISVQIFMYLNPKITDFTYHAFWIYTDTLSILLDALCFRELLARCPQDKWLCMSAYLLLFHVLLKFHESILREALHDYQSWYKARVLINFLLTILQAFTIYRSNEVLYERSQATF